MGQFSDMQDAWIFLREHPVTLVKNFDGRPAHMIDVCFTVRIAEESPFKEGSIHKEKRENDSLRIEVRLNLMLPAELLKIMFWKDCPEEISDFSAITCTAPTLEEAVIKLAEAVLERYGGICSHCEEWCCDDRVKTRMKCGPCNYGYPGGGHVEYI